MTDETYVLAEQITLSRENLSALLATARADALDRVATLERQFAEMREALRRAYVHGVHSQTYHALEAARLTGWIASGMRGPLPEIKSPFVLEALVALTPASDASGEILGGVMDHEAGCKAPEYGHCTCKAADASGEKWHDSQSRRSRLAHISHLDASGEPSHTHPSGNVFADIGVAEPEKALADADRRIGERREAERIEGDQAMKWIKFNGYHETHQYVDANGQIVGEVRGSTFERDSGWRAIDERSKPSINLGRYTTLPYAREAVERAIARLDSTGAGKEG